MRVPQHQVRVRPGDDGAFAGEYVEDLRGVGRGDGDKLRRREHSGLDTLRPEHRHSILHAARAVGNLPEIVLTHRLLRGTEAAVVRRGGVDQAGLQTFPQ